MAQIKVEDFINIGKTVHDVLTREASKSTTDMTKSDVPKVAPEMTKEIKQQVDKLQDVVNNQTNQEPLWKSRVMRGAIGVLAATTWTAFNDFTDGTPPDLSAIIGYLTAYATAAYTIYGRITASGTPTI